MKHIRVASCAKGITDDRERRYVFEALMCLKLEWFVSVIKNCVFVSGFNMYAFALPPKTSKNKTIIWLSEEMFNEEGHEVCVKVILHEIAHYLINSKILVIPKKANTEKACDDFAKEQYKFLGRERRYSQQRIG